MYLIYNEIIKSYDLNNNYNNINNNVKAEV